MKMKTRTLDLHTLKEALADYLPEAQKPFAGTKNYAALCEALLGYLKSDGDEREAKKQEFGYVKEIFEHMCRTTQPPELPRWQQEVNRCLQ